jgi:predicted nucleic acid-binding protein
MHQLMIAEARDYQWIKGPNPAKQLALAPDRVRALTKYEELVRDIIGTGLQIEPVVQEDFITAMAVQRQAGLLTNDALLVAVGERLRVTNIASADKAFAHVQGILLYTPEDILL